jgi:transcription antitermination protein NusB
VRARSRARGWALQALYAWEGQGRGVLFAQSFREFAAERTISATAREYLDVLVETLSARADAIDRALADALTNWRIERLSVIDRNILRIGAAEILFIDEVPPKVSIQEAIMLAEKYGTRESPRFVNGVLDALMRHAGAASGARGGGR